MRQASRAMQQRRQILRIIVEGKTMSDLTEWSHVHDNAISGRLHRRNVGLFRQVGFALNRTISRQATAVAAINIGAGSGTPKPATCEPAPAAPPGFPKLLRHR